MGSNIFKEHQLEQRKEDHTHTKKETSLILSQMLWLTPIIQTSRKLKRDDQEFEASLSYMRPYFKKFEGWRDGSVDEDGLLPNLII